MIPNEAERQSFFHDLTAGEMYSLFGIFDLDNFLNMEKLLVSLCDLFAGKLFTTLDTKLEYTKEMMVVGQNAFNLTYIFQMG